MSIKETWWKNYGRVVFFFISIILAGIIGFYFGKINTQNNIPINIDLKNTESTNPTKEKTEAILKSLERQGINTGLKDSFEENLSTIDQKDCLFVASRKSKKYHTKDCKYAKNIKISNRICFKSQEEAKKMGYIPAKGCLGHK